MEESAKEETKVSVSNVVDSTHANFTESVEASHSSHDISQRIARELGTQNQGKRKRVVQLTYCAWVKVSPWLQSAWTVSASTLLWRAVMLRSTLD